MGTYIATAADGTYKYGNGTGIGEFAHTVIIEVSAASGFCELELMGKPAYAFSRGFGSWFIMEHTGSPVLTWERNGSF